MNKGKEILERRSKYIKERVEKARNCDNEVRRLSNELFLSERTIYRDLKK